MESEADLIRKYERILTTMRTQIRSLKAKVTVADESRRPSRKRASPSPVGDIQDFALIEFKEELVRKEFELEECLLELEEVKTELRKQTGKKTPGNFAASPGSEEIEVGNQEVMSWEEEIQVRDDLSGTKDDREPLSAFYQQDPDPELDILRQKIDLVERENRLLREKADLCENEIHTLLTKSQKTDSSQMKVRGLERELKEKEKVISDLQAKLRREDRERLTTESPNRRSGPRQRSMEEELKRAKEEQAEKDKLLASVSLRVSQLSEEPKPSQSSRSHLWKEVEDELNRQIGSPRPSLVQLKIESLHGSVNSKVSNPVSITALLQEKDNAISDLKRKFELLSEQYHALQRVQNQPKLVEDSKDLPQPVKTAPIEEVKVLPDATQELLIRKQAQTTESQQSRPVSRGEVKALASSMKGAIRKQEPDPSSNRLTGAKRIVNVFRGKPGGGRTPK